MAEMDELGGKRKFKENAFTAKAETGTLKVKILRKDGVKNGKLQDNKSLKISATAGTVRLKAWEPSTSVDDPQSPPKPRPNRKHVPIFYQRQSVSSSTSTDDQQFSSTTSIGDNLGVSSTSTTSNSQDSTRFSSLLTSLQLQSGSSVASASGKTGTTNLFPSLPPEGTNPLFSRSDSDGISYFGDLLPSAFPSANGPAPPRLGSFPSASLGSLLEVGSNSALHQLATSSTSYERSNMSIASTLVSTKETSTMSATAASPSASNSTEGVATYRFNPFSALQSAIAAHQATLGITSPSNATISAPTTYSSAQERQETSHSDRQATSPAADDNVADLGPPPSAPPSFMIQNSLMGGGIEMQPVIANVNTHNFDWTRNEERRLRSGSSPSPPKQEQQSSSPVHGGSNSSHTASGRIVHASNI